MSALGTMIQAKVQAKTGTPEATGPHMGICDRAGQLWINKSNNTGLAFLSGPFGRGRLALHQTTKTNPNQPDWFSYLSQPVPEEKRGDKTYKSPSVPWSGYWEKKTPDGKILLQATFQAATETEPGIMHEFIKVSEGDNNQPMFTGRFRAIPKRPPVTEGSAPGTVEGEAPATPMAEGEVPNENGTDSVSNEAVDPNGIPFQLLK